MLKFIFSILLIGSFAFAISDETTCASLCSKCIESQSDLCTEIVGTCKCTVINYSENSISTKENKPNDSAIMKVDFGHKGDSEYTAVLKDDGTYENKEKDNTSLWVVLGIIVTAITIAIFASN